MEKSDCSPIFARLRDSYVYDLPKEYVFLGRDCIDPTYYRFLILYKVRCGVTPTSSIESSVSTVTATTIETDGRSIIDSPASLLTSHTEHGSLASDTLPYQRVGDGMHSREFFTSVLVNVLKDGAKGEEMTSKVPSYSSLLADNHSTPVSRRNWKSKHMKQPLPNPVTVSCIEFSEFRFSVESYERFITEHLTQMSRGRHVLKTYGLIGCIR